MDCSPSCSSVRGIFQARILECCHFILQGSSQPKGWTRAAYISYIVRQILYHWSTWEAHCWPYQVPKCTSYSLHLWKYQPLRMFCVVSAMSGHPVIRYFLVIYKIYCQNILPFCQALLTQHSIQIVKHIPFFFLILIIIWQFFFFLWKWGT